MQVNLILTSFRTNNKVLHCNVHLYQRNEKFNTLGRLMTSFFKALSFVEFKNEIFPFGLPSDKSSFFCSSVVIYESPKCLIMMILYHLISHQELYQTGLSRDCRFCPNEVSATFWLPRLPSRFLVRQNVLVPKST